MVVILDIGNSKVHCALFEGRTIKKKFAFLSSEKSDIFARLKPLTKSINGAAFCSVVPSATRYFNAFFKQKFNIKPLIVSSRTPCDLRFDYDRPQTLGADRIANVIGGLYEYKKNIIVIDFGTAITIDVALKNHQYLGGIITPGVELGVCCLAEHTAQLKKVVLKKPRHIIGHSTGECIWSGLYNGALLMVEGFIRQIKQEIKRSFVCIATGGWGKNPAKEITDIDYYEPDLTLKGVREIYSYYEQNTKKI